ncbi:MAG: glycosyltransferase family 39 protein [Desulfobacterales bacterium]|nr:glycosyltransferase family 39 protein [Desulfobacterales bacterium]
MPQKLKKNSFDFYILLSIAILIGFILRYYNLPYQILLDDEWHALDYVPGKSLFYLLTHWGLSANSIPMNIYLYCLLHTIGWSELVLRFLPLVFGMLCVIIFPFFGKKIAGNRVAIFFALLLAISPFLIFYSRESRAYGATSFLVFFSIISLYFWIISGRSRYAVAYVFSGALSVYFHLFALVGVLSPFGFIIPYWLSSDNRKNEKIHIKLAHIIIVLLSVFILISVLLGTALVLSPFPMVKSEDYASIESFIGVLSLLSGVANPFYIALFMCMLIWGFVLLCKRRILLSGMLFFVVLFYVLSIISVKHDSINMSLEIARFSICIFPISYLLVAISTDHLLSRIETSRIISRIQYGTILIPNLIGFCIIIVLFLEGPLLSIYGMVNNFTNHVLFQYSYEKKSWECSFNPNFPIYKKDINAFYLWLSTQENTKKIIEYPMYIGSSFNFYYFYQYVHQKEVIGGYITNIAILYPSIGKIFGNYYIDFPLSRIKNSDQLKFNMVNMEDKASIIKSGATFVILHKNLLIEMSHRSAIKENNLNTPDLFQNNIYTPVLYLENIYQNYFGKPIFADQNIIAYKIH